MYRRKLGCEHAIVTYAMALGKTLGSVMTYGGHLQSEKAIFGCGSPLGFYRFKFHVCLRRNDQLHPVAPSTNNNLPAALHALPPKSKSQLRLSSLFRNPVFSKFCFRIAVDWFLIVSIRMVLQCCNSACANPNGMVAQQFSWRSWVTASGF